MRKYLAGIIALFALMILPASALATATPQVKYNFNRFPCSSTSTSIGNSLINSNTGDPVLTLANGAHTVPGEGYSASENPDQCAGFFDGSVNATNSFGHVYNDVTDETKLMPVDDYTVSARVNSDFTGWAWENVLMRDTSSQIDYALYSTKGGDSGGHSAGYVRFVSNVSPFGEQVEVIGPRIDDQTWHTLTLKVVESTCTVSLYVDGTLEDQNSCSLTGTISDHGNSSGEFTVGGNNLAGEYFDGKIDNVYFFNSALSDADRAAYGI